MPFRARRQISWIRLTAVLTILASALVVALAALTAGPAQAGGQSLSQLNSQLGTNASVQSNLQADIRSLNGQIAGLQHQIALVRGREAEVQAQLAGDRRQLALTHARLHAETLRLQRLQRALDHARTILAAQLVSSYERPQPTLVSLVLTAHGFQQMLDELQFLKIAEHSQQRIIAFTREAKAAATRAANRLKAIQATERTQTAAASTQARALAGMNGLLSGREAALNHIESARQTALANARAEGSRLRGAIATIRAQQAAAARAAAAAAAAAAARAAAAAQRNASRTAAPSSPGAPVGAAPSGGWAIPAAIVMCESGGQNLPPNSAGASGYYQILPSTWTGEGGSGPAAYLAPKSEQDAIAAKLWNGGAGASNWVCAGIVGIS